MGVGPIYKLAAPRKVCFWPAFVAQILIPRSQKSGYGLFLGCRSGLDRQPFETTFFDDFEPPKRKIFTVCSALMVPYRNRSGVVEFVGREPLMFTKVENDVTESCQLFRRKNRKCNFGLKLSPLFLSRIACCSRESTLA